MSNFIQAIVNGFTTVSDKIVNLKDTITALNTVYVSKSDLNAPFNPPSLDGNGMIRSHQIPSSSMPLKVVADIATRDALTNLPNPCQVFVTDASADGVQGGAYYIYTTENGFTKTNDAGNVQLEVDYLDIKNKPTVFVPDVHTHSEYVNKSDKTSYIKNIKINNQLATVIDNVANITIDVQQVTSTSGSPVDMSMYAFAIHNHDDLYARYDYLLSQDGKFKANLMPKITISDTFDVNNQVQMLALTAEKGDMARRLDFTPPRIYVLQGDNPATLSNWIELSIPTDVTATINSQKGIAGGLASLGTDGKVPLSQLPLISPTASLTEPNVSYTSVFLTHFENAITDEYGHAITNTNCVLSNTKSKFGTQSLRLSSNGLIKTSLPINNTDFVIEGWFNLDAYGYQILCTTYDHPNNILSGFNVMTDTVGKIHINFNNGSGVSYGSAGLVPLNTWFYLVISYIDGVFKVRVNSTIAYSASVSFTRVQNLVFGYTMTGYIDELKVSTKSSGYIVPTTAYAT